MEHFTKVIIPGLEESTVEELWEDYLPKIIFKTKGSCLESLIMDNLDSDVIPREERSIFFFKNTDTMYYSVANIYFKLKMILSEVVLTKDEIIQIIPYFFDKILKGFETDFSFIFLLITEEGIKRIRLRYSSDNDIFNFWEEDLNEEELLFKRDVSTHYYDLIFVLNKIKRITILDSDYNTGVIPNYRFKSRSK